MLAEFGQRIEVHTFHSLSYRLLSDFGRYTGFGRETPSIESEARAKLLGRDGTRLSYDDLIPIALQLMERERIAELARQRWTLVVCDEFQDTSSDQWELLRKLSMNGRLLVFADPHQMIHSWRPTVTSRRLEEACDEADRVIELEEASHRDPSGVIPAMAARVREREFDHEAMQSALQAGQDLEVGTVREWLKQVGDPVKKGEPIVLVETEKISLDVVSPADGFLRQILVPAGTETAIFSVIGIVADQDEPIP